MYNILLIIMGDRGPVRVINEPCLVRSLLSPTPPRFSFSLDWWPVLKMLPPLSLLALCLVSVISPVLAGTPGAFADAGNTLISVMMVSNPGVILPHPHLLSLRCSSVMKRWFIFSIRRRVTLPK